MKILGWYAVVFNLLIIALVLLAGIKVISPPPFTWLESVVWIALEIPVVVLGISVARKPS